MALSTDTDGYDAARDEVDSLASLWDMSADDPEILSAGCDILATRGTMITEPELSKLIVDLIGAVRGGL